MKKGKIIPNGVPLEKHEYDTILFLTTLGYDIELIPPSHTPGVRTPDFKMNNISWEMKCPRGRGKYLIRDTIINALQQSNYIVIDLRRIKLHQTKCLNSIRKYFHLYKSIANIIIITKDAKIVDLKR